MFRIKFVNPNHRAHVRLEHSEATVNLVQFQDEVEVLRTTVNKSTYIIHYICIYKYIDNTYLAAADLVNKKSEVGNLKTDMQEKQNKLEKSRQHKTESKNKLARITDSTMTMEAKAQEVYITIN